MRSQLPLLQLRQELLAYLGNAVPPAGHRQQQQQQVVGVQLVHSMQLLQLISRSSYATTVSLAAGAMFLCSSLALGQRELFLQGHTTTCCMQAAVANHSPLA
jgi:hypothetical protein